MRVMSSGGIFCVSVNGDVNPFGIIPATGSGVQHVQDFSYLFSDISENLPSVQLSC